MRRGAFGESVSPGRLKPVGKRPHACPADAVLEIDATCRVLSWKPFPGIEPPRLWSFPKPA